MFVLTMISAISWKMELLGTSELSAAPSWDFCRIIRDTDLRTLAKASWSLAAVGELENRIAFLISIHN